MKRLLMFTMWMLLTACGSLPEPELGSVALAATGSTALANGVSPFVSADLTAGTTVIPTRTQAIGSMTGILTVLDSNRVNKPASQGGGFRVTSITGGGITQIHDMSIVSWTTYDTNAGGPVAFPPNPHPSGISAFIAADLTALSVVDATHSNLMSWGCFGWTLDAINRVNAPASQGGGFQISSDNPNHQHTQSCDTSSFRWAVH